MTTAEIVVRAAVYALATLVVLAWAIWYGWHLRERLAVKLEWFRISNRAWLEYDAQLKANKGKVPMRGELVGFGER